MDNCYDLLKERFSNVNIRYHNSFGILIVKCTDLSQQFLDIKKIIKILIFEIQSKHIKKDTIVLEFLDKDVLTDNFINLLTVMKFTKTSHYFNIIIKKKDVNEFELKQRIEYIMSNFIGLNINKGITHERI